MAPQRDADVPLPETQAVERADPAAAPIDRQAKTLPPAADESAAAEGSITAAAEASAQRRFGEPPNGWRVTRGITPTMPLRASRQAWCV